LLAHPLARGIDIDDPAATSVRRAIIAGNPFLLAIYRDWYRDLAAVLPPGREPVLELGSGAGFMRQHIPGLIASDVLRCGGVDVVLDAGRLPFGERSLRGIAMTNVLHHIPDVQCFFRDAARCVRPGGVMAMIEPWVTPWSRLVYSGLHHEPFSPEAAEWTFPSTGPLSGANGALPWIVFERDRSRFSQQFPCWRLQSVDLRMPFMYLFSGGVSMRRLLPGVAAPLCRLVERAFTPWIHRWAMFARIVLRREATTT
jgi:SAM-dependent methyltransferase